jgi:hypothetical protein
MLKHTKEIVIPIFNYAFPNCEALFAFDNSSNHSSFAPDALLASRMNLFPGGNQPKMRDGWNYQKNLPQSMTFDENDRISTLQGQPKGQKQILMERGLWPEICTNGTKFLLKCPAKNNKSTCDNSGKCCSTALLQSQPDFQNQKGWLQEEIEAAGHNVIFYPKFHYELYFIERFWCAAKYYARENCSYTIEGLRKNILEAFKSISSATINRYYKHCCKIINAYNSGLKYGTEEFTQRVYTSHRQVTDKSKW